jgi:hypothetical protein
MSDDAGGEAPGRHRCADCGTLSPKTDTNFTLISARYGWRLIRGVDGTSGRSRVEWRCPRCWEAYRKHESA